MAHFWPLMHGALLQLRDVKGKLLKTNLRLGFSEFQLESISENAQTVERHQTRQ